MTARELPSTLGSIDLHVNVEFRLAREEDLSLLEWYGQYTHFRRLFRATYREQVSGKRLMLLADMNGFPVGHIFIALDLGKRRLNRMHSKQVNTRRGYLYSLRVMEHMRGMRLGTHLILYAEQLLRKHGTPWSTISVAKINNSARRLYERLGYYIYGEDEGRWQYTNHLGEIVQMHEPCWMLEKRLL